MTDATRETVYGIIERWGFPTLVALACGWVLRQDVLLPLVEEHRSFVKQLGATQQEISRAISEQTKLLYALQPREKAYTVKAADDDKVRN
jgi:hypothetical protein